MSLQIQTDLESRLSQVTDGTLSEKCLSWTRVERDGCETETESTQREPSSDKLLMLLSEE